jgi:hypothetical protein
MTRSIININVVSELDKQIIPAEIYDITISKETDKIMNYFILHPRLMFSFIGYNSSLKLANQLNYNRKCGCYYNIPWLTQYGKENNIKTTVLSFSQQVQEYDYMILNWKPSSTISYMHYLSQIALSMVLDINQYFYYQSNNLETCTIFQKKYYLNNFKSPKNFVNYIKYYRN